MIIWNPHSGTKIRSFRTTANGGTRSVAFSPDGKRLAIGTQRFHNQDGFRDVSTGAVSLVQVSSGIVDWLQTVPGWANPVAFLPDGKSIAVLCGGRSIRFLESKTGKVKHEIRSADREKWTDFALPSQRHMLAIGGVDKDRKVQNGSVELWNFDGLGTAANSAPVKSPSEGR